MMRTEDKRRMMNDLKMYNEESVKCEQGLITEKELKKTSCGFGNYPQREIEGQMLRLRISGGRLRKEQLRAIIEACRENGAEKIKISTGQSIQLHDLTLKAVRAIAPKLLEAGIPTRGSGGNHPANVMCSPLSGVDRDEYFDVMPYADVVTDYINSIVGTVVFPRKFKISFSNSQKNVTHATFRDLGFAANPDGTFRVYAAGGLGVKPGMGIQVESHMPKEKVLYYVKAMLDVFREHGNYENRNRARSRYLLETLGADQLLELIHKREAELERTEELEVFPQISAEEKTGTGTHQEHKRLYKQKQSNLYAVMYHPLGGYLSTDRLEELYHAIEHIEGAEIRLTPDGGMYFINCDAEEADTLLELTETDGAQTLFETSVSCVGRQRCDIGVCRSQQLLQACVEEAAKQGFADLVLPRMHISGCMSSCSSHQTAGLGFRGTMKRTENGPEEAYCIYWGGCEQQNREIIAEPGGFILAKNIPTFLVELGRMIEADDSVYDEWIRLHADQMQALIDRYKIA